MMLRLKRKTLGKLDPNGGDRIMWCNGSFSSCKKSCYIFYALAACFPKTTQIENKHFSTELS